MPETMADTSGPKECLVQGLNGLETAGYRQFPIEMRFSSLWSQRSISPWAWAVIAARSTL